MAAPRDAANFAPLSQDERRVLTQTSAGSVTAQLAALMHANKTRVLDLFQALDKNADGEVNKFELKQALQALGVKANGSEVDDLFRSSTQIKVVELSFASCNWQSSLLRESSSRSSPRRKDLLHERHCWHWARTPTDLLRMQRQSRRRRPPHLSRYRQSL